MEIKQSTCLRSNVWNRTHHSVRGFMAIAAIAILAIATLVAATPTQAQDQSAEPLWSADMSVVEITSVSIGADKADLFSNVGGTAGLQIKSLWSYTPGRDIRLAFEESVPGAADLTLQVGDLALEFPAGSSGQSGFKWKDVEVDWEDGQTIAVSIVPTAATVAPQSNSPATGTPMISGTAQAGQTLTADTSGIADEDGLTNVSYSYQWIANDGATDTDIQDATASTYIPSISEVSQTVKVRVSFTDDDNNQESLTSAATAAVAATVPTQPLGFTVTRGGQVRELDASWQAPSSNGGAAITGFKVRWKKAADSWDDEADVSEEPVTGNTYTITGLTGGVEYAVRVIATNDIGDGPVSAEATGTPAGDTLQQNVVEDTTNPTILSVAITSDADDDGGVYGIGARIEVTVTFNEEVVVTGSPQLEIEIGNAAKDAHYESFDGSAVVFIYRVLEGDEDNDGVSIGTSKLNLNGGRIQDATDNDADLTHGPLPSQGDHLVDGIRPIITDITLVSSSYNKDGFLTIGEMLFLSARFSEPVNVKGSPQVMVDLDGTTRLAGFQGGFTECFGICGMSYDPFLDGLVRLSFIYEVVQGDLDLDGVSLGADSLILNDGTIKDEAGNDAVLSHEMIASDLDFKVDGVPPTVSSIAITSDPGEDNTYHIYDKIGFTVTFSETVRIRQGVHEEPGRRYPVPPELEVNIGGVARAAKYRGHTGATAEFTYSVRAGDTDEDGISIDANKLTLSGGKITDNHYLYPSDADLRHESVGRQRGS